MLALIRRREQQEGFYLARLRSIFSLLSPPTDVPLLNERRPPLPQASIIDAPDERARSRGSVVFGACIPHRLIDARLAIRRSNVAAACDDALIFPISRGESLRVVVGGKAGYSSHQALTNWLAPWRDNLTRPDARIRHRLLVTRGNCAAASGWASSAKVKQHGVRTQRACFHSLSHARHESGSQRRGERRRRLGAGEWWRDGASPRGASSFIK